jgi:outer membrane biosynthesis protein TonB
MPHKGQEEIMKKATAKPTAQTADLVTAIAQAVAAALGQTLAQFASVVTAPEPIAPAPAPEPKAKATRKRKAKDAPAPESKPARKAKAKVEPAKPAQPAEPKRARKVTEPVAQPEPEAKPEPKAKPRRRKPAADQSAILRVAAHLAGFDPWNRGLYRLAQILENRCRALGDLAPAYLARVAQLQGKEAVKFALQGSRDLRAQLGKGER